MKCFHFFTLIPNSLYLAVCSLVLLLMLELFPDQCECLAQPTLNLTTEGKNKTKQNKKKTIDTFSL